MLKESWKTLVPKIKDCVFDGDKYKPEIASILATRFLNYSSYYFSQKGSKDSIVNDRLIEFLDSKDKLLSEDLYFHIVKTLISKFPKRTSKLLLHPKVRKIVV